VRVKTSVTLQKELARLERQEKDRKDVVIINRYAARLNREAKDTLEYQRIP
jgi:hypothetical protein